MVSGGGRAKGIQKKAASNNPLLSVITVVYNDVNDLELTISNIINQKYKNIEFIIIDGGSTDGSVELIKQYDDVIDYWVSEPDKGIYDAMNKGIILATGNWINFMNAGDLFFDLDTCSLIAKIINENKHDLIYGDFSAINTATNTKLPIKARPLKTLYTNMAFCHQSVFVKRDILLVHLFNINYKIVADHDQILTLYNERYRFGYVEKILTTVNINGVSYSNIKTISEKVRMIHNHKPYSVTLLHFIPQFLNSILRNILGSKLTNTIRNYKWQILKARR